MCLFTTAVTATAFSPPSSSDTLAFGLIPARVFLFENITYLQCVTKRQCQSVPLQKHQISDIRVTIAQMHLINRSILK